MKKLISNIPDGGAPYFNTEISDILQDNQLKSYKAILDAINDKGPNDENNGIILKGVILMTQSAHDKELKDVDILVDMTDSLIYLNGEFLEYDPNGPNFLSFNYDSSTTVPGRSFQSFLEDDGLSLDAGISLSQGRRGLYFYLYALPPTYEERRNKVQDFPIQVLETKYFTVNTIKPQNQPYIRVGSQCLNSNTAPRANVEIKPNLIACSRYLRRLLKYHQSQKGQLYLALNDSLAPGSQYSYFTTGGLGYGDYLGFKLIQDFGNIFPIGFDGSLSGTSLVNDVLANYSIVGATGGVESVVLDKSELPGHTHNLNIPYDPNTGLSMNLGHAHGLLISKTMYPNNQNAQRFPGISNTFNTLLQANRVPAGWTSKTRLVYGQATVPYTSLNSTLNNLTDGYQLPAGPYPDILDMNDQPFQLQHTHLVGSPSVLTSGVDIDLAHNNIPYVGNTSLEILYYTKV
jgi:hypothetical protein